jgi:hypothetical protein
VALDQTVSSSGDSFGAAHSPAFRRVWLALAFSGIAWQALNVVFPFLVFELADSTAAVGRYLAVRALFVTAFSLGIGLVADRAPRLWLLRCAVLANLLIVLAFLVLDASRGIAVQHVTILGGIAGGISTGIVVLYRTLLPEIVHSDDLVSANVLSDIGPGGRIALIFVPAAAAALTGEFGVAAALGLAAVAISIASVILLKSRIEPLGASIDVDRGALPSGQFVHSQSLFVLVMFGLMAASLLTTAVAGRSLPRYLSDTFAAGPGMLGITLFVANVCGLGATIVLGAYGNVRRTARLAVAALFSIALLHTALSLSNVLALSVALFGASVAAHAIFGSAVVTTLQRHAPANRRGIVMGALGAMSSFLPATFLAVVANWSTGGAGGERSVMFFAGVSALAAASVAALALRRIPNEDVEDSPSGAAPGLV